MTNPQDPNAPNPEHTENSANSANPATPENAPIDAEIVEDPAPVQVPPGDYTEGGVPNFDYVRDQIENRFATSAGSGELAAQTPQGRSVDEQFAAREKAGRDRLEEIRRAMRES
ncbi:hypothetical protein BLA60_23460 [Actinophytocola xinjiangensis]|uniref:PspA domain-containing protein n=1 Tax=Actinophytocola xinjiangensis TaxID=485602 RepID=A0A7Z0WJC0_9PSEU|nr:hypothetical protein [Actinophytocola xinjiangensis]OLF08378.1 hypothetical protein BLA60_23460 [Actinophytocola xinjiangensis]